MWEEQGYRPDEYGHWLKGGWQPYSGPQNILHRPKGLILSADGQAAIPVDDVEDVALPLYQGAMIYHFDFCAAAYRQIEGKRGFKWIPMSWDAKQVQPQYLMGRDDYRQEGNLPGFSKPVIRDIASSTNERTLVSAVVPGRPCGHTLAELRTTGGFEDGLISVLNSFVLDFSIRMRMVGSHLILYVLGDLPLLCRAEISSGALLLRLGRGLMRPAEVYSRDWLPSRSGVAWRAQWARTPAERLRCRALSEALIAHEFGLSEREFGDVVADCDHPTKALASKPFSRTLDTKGFWRFEKDKDPELRIAVLAQVAFRELERVGLRDFLQMNDGEGWMLPETLRLADYGLGHDDRAKEPQPVASRLGPRFYDWQLEQGVDESWEECERHAEILDRILPSKQDVPEPTNEDGETSAPTDLFGNPLPTDLFGNVLLPQKKGRR